MRDRAGSIQLSLFSRKARFPSANVLQADGAPFVAGRTGLLRAGRIGDVFFDFFAAVLPNRQRTPPIMAITKTVSDDQTLRIHIAFLELFQLSRAESETCICAADSD